jgi:hypothetical protein
MEEYDKLIETKGFDRQNTFAANFCAKEIDLDNYNFHYINEFHKLSEVSKKNVESLSFRQNGQNYYPMLTEFQELFHDNLMSVVKMFPNLKRLTLENYPLLTDDQFGGISILVFERLIVISLTKNSSLSQKTFKRISNNCVSLIKLNFSCRFFLGYSFSPATNNVAGERYYSLEAEDILRLLKNNSELNKLCLMSKLVPDNVFEAIAKSGSIEFVCLIVQRLDTFNVNSFMQLVLSPLFERVDIFLELNQVIEYIRDRELKIENTFDKAYDDVWNIQLNLVFNSLPKLKSIKLHGFRLTDELRMTLVKKQKDLEMLICEECHCAFENGFVEEFVENFEKLQFLFVGSEIDSIDKTSLSFIAERLIIAIVLNGELIEGNEIRILRKKIRNLRKGLSDRQLDVTIDACLCNNSIGSSHYEEDDEDDLDEGVVSNEIELPINEHNLGDEVIDNEEEVNTIQNAVSGRVLKRTRGL